jgi:energy-converting hydrogenase Eha subunit B
MTKWIEQVRKRKGLQNLILITLFGVLFFLPEQYILTDIAYVLIVFLIAYISSYLQTDPIWKGLFYSLIVTLIVVVVFLSIITLFPHIPYMLLLVIVAVTAGLSVYWIG